MSLTHAAAPVQAVTRQVLAGLPIGYLVRLAILTVISMVGLTQSLDQMAGRPFDECHERELDRIRCNPWA